jgi:hypothetical protein
VDLIDDNALLLQILFQREAVMPSLFKKDDAFVQGRTGFHGLKQCLKASAAVIEGKHGAGTEAFMATEKTLGDEACGVGQFRDVDANTKKLQWILLGWCMWWVSRTMVVCLNHEEGIEMPLRFQEVCAA